VRQLPAVTGFDDFDALIFRTDYREDEAWQHVAAALTAPWGLEDYDAYVHFVDDPAWADATVDEVLAAVAWNEYVGVIFIADHATMTADHHALLAVTTLTPDDLGEEHYQWETKFGREYRTVPSEVQGIKANENVANMDFNEFSGAAYEEPDGVFRGFE
jgi:hypothetical protein